MRKSARAPYFKQWQREHPDEFDEVPVNSCDRDDEEVVPDREVKVAEGSLPVRSEEGAQLVNVSTNGMEVEPATSTPHAATPHPTQHLEEGSDQAATPPATPGSPATKDQHAQADVTEATPAPTAHRLVEQTSQTTEQGSPVANNNGTPQQTIKPAQRVDVDLTIDDAVSYTHLTLPTKRIV